MVLVQAALLGAEAESSWGGHERNSGREQGEVIGWGDVVKCSESGQGAYAEGAYAT